MYTPDYMFSYWIFAWYLLYVLCIIPYNPNGWIIFAIIMSVYNVVCMVTYQYYYMLFLFLILLSAIKFIPLYTIFHTQHTMNDFLFGIGLFFVYCLWIRYNNQSVVHLIETFYLSDVYIKDNNVEHSHVMKWIDSIINRDTHHSI